MQINSRQRKPKSSAKKKAGNRSTTMPTTRFDKRIRGESLHDTGTPHTLDAAIKNCTRSLAPHQPGIPAGCMHSQYWNENRLGALMAVKNGLIPFVVI